MYEGMIDPGRWPKSYSCERTFAKLPEKAPTSAFSLLRVPIPLSEFMEFMDTMINGLLELSIMYINVIIFKHYMI